MDTIDNRYLVLELIGTGGIGQVFKVHDLLTDKVLALKSLSPSTHYPVADFKEEFNILTQLRHPFLIRVYDYGADAQGRAYFTMDYVSGGDISARLGSLDIIDSFRYALMILSALDYIHSRGVLHGDLKPANIMFDGAGNIKLVDFGLAFHFREETMRRRSGTLEYIPPEVLARGRLSAASDLYSFALILYQMLFNKQLIGGTTSQILSQKLERSLELPPVPEELGGDKMRRFLTGLLEFEVEKRPANAGEASRMLKGVLRPFFRGGPESGRSYFERAAFCGRQHEFAKLTGASASLKARESSCIAICGEPGVGKSRLIEQFKYYVQTDGGQFFESTCISRSDRPFGPLLLILRQLIEKHDPERKLLDDIGYEIKRLFPEYYGSSSAEPDLRSGKRQLIDNLIRYFLEISLEQNLVIALEDIDLADDLTFEFIIALAARLRGDQDPAAGRYGICLVVTYQPAPNLDQVSIKNGFEIIELKPADGELWNSYLEALFGGDSPPPEFSRRLHDETGGNFLFAEESLKVLADEGILIRHAGGWRINTEKLERFPLPRTVIEAVRQRITVLEPGSLLIVEMAAVMEPSIDGVDLLGLAGFQGDEEFLLNELVNLGIFRRTNGKLRFHHNQIKDVVYSLLPSNKKCAFHSKAAAYYEKQGAEPEILARHFLAAGEYGRAYEALLKAANRAAAVFAWTQAIRDYDQILWILSRWKDAPAGAAYIALSGAGQAMMFVDPKKAADYLERAVEESRKAENPGRASLTAKLHLAANCQHLGDNERSVKLYGEILENAGEWPDLLAESNLGIGFVLSKMGRLDDAAKSYLKALDLFVDNPEKLCRVLSNLGIIYKRKGDFAGALDFYGRALDVCRRYDYKWAAMNLHGNMANIYSARGEFQKALESYRESLDLCRKVSDRRIEGINLLNIGHLHFLLGNMNEAVDHFLKALRLQKAVGDRGSQAITYNNLGQACLNLGQYKSALEYYEKGRSLSRQIKEPRIELANLRGLADTALVLGDLQEADERARQALILAETIGDQEQKTWVDILLAEIEYEQGNKVGAADRIGTIFATEPSDSELRARCLLTQTRMEIESGNMVKAESCLRELAAIDLPAGTKAATHYYRALFLLNREKTAINFQKAEDELRKSIMLAEKYGPAKLRPSSWILLADIKKISGGDYRKEMEKAQILANGFCIGLPEKSKRGFLVSLKLEKGDEIPGKVKAVEKSSREKRLETLLEVSKSINSILELDPLLNRVMDLLLENLEGERGFIMLKENESGFEPVVARNIDKENILGELTISRSTIDDVFRSGRPLIMNRAPDELSDRESVVDFNILSIMCAPLVVRDQPIGIVYIDNRFGGRAFDKEDLDFLQGFCNLASIAIENARLTTNLSARNLYLQKQIEKASGFGNIIGRSSAMQKVFRMAEAVAATEATVVLTGESGTGKEILARAIHYSGPRKNGRFIPVDCGALPETLLETELFGHKKGSFTGAVSDRPGLFEEADGGTIFLDEITNTTQNFQVKLLRVIQEGEFRRVGESRGRKVNVRIISATNKDIAEEVSAGRFREDLYYRLNVVNIHIPALRERKEDIPILAEYFLDNICRKMKIPKKNLSSRAIDYLSNYRWPGNVRQLENIIERMVIFAKSGTIDVPDLPQEIRAIIDNLSADNKAQFPIPKSKVELKTAKAQLDRLFLTAIIEQAGGNIMQAARLSGMDRTQLHHMLNKLKIDVDKYRNRNGG